MGTNNEPITNKNTLLREINKNFKIIKINSSNKTIYKKITIIFFHGMNHASLNYNYTYEGNKKVGKNYFLDKLCNIGNLLLYDRPEEMLRFNYERGKSNYNVEYPNYNLDSHVKNLYKFLLNKNIKGPYVLVSHSIGALYALKFAQKFPSNVKHVFLIDPIQFTKEIAKSFMSNPLSKQNIKKQLDIINSPKSTKKEINKSLQILDSNTYSIPYFKPKLECPLTTFFNIDTKSNVHTKFTLPYVEELKKYNPTTTNYYFYDRDHYLNETNPQGIVTKIKKELEYTLKKDN